MYLPWNSRGLHLEYLESHRQVEQRAFLDVDAVVAYSWAAHYGPTLWPASLWFILACIEIEGCKNERLQRLRRSHVRFPIAYSVTSPHTVAGESIGGRTSRVRIMYKPVV